MKIEFSKRAGLDQELDEALNILAKRLENSHMTIDDIESLLVKGLRSKGHTMIETGEILGLPRSTIYRKYSPKLTLGAKDGKPAKKKDTLEVK